MSMPWPDWTEEQWRAAVRRQRALGGPGSGNYGHAGRPGEVGGSSDSDQWKKEPFNTSLTHYIGGDIPDNPRMPIFTTPDRTGADWYSRERADEGQGKTHAIKIDAQKPFAIRNEDDIKKLLPILDEAGVIYIFTPSGKEQGWWLDVPEVREHSGYDGGNPLDVSYIPKVRDVLVAHGYDSLQAWDPLEMLHDIPTTVLIKSPTQMRRVRDLAGPVKFKFNVASQDAVDWADRHAAELIADISESTREAINNAIAEALEQGDIESAYDEILEAVGDEKRARLIARHETMKAASEGQRQAWGQAVDKGLLTGNEKRQWLAVGDDKVCPICESLDGEITDLDGQYPGDGGDGPPAHVACRCTEGIA